MEDHDRVVYPICENLPDLRRILAEELQVEGSITGAVTQVKFEKATFAYKKISRPLYLPGDTEA
jgi:hypothetical protein